MLIFEGFAPRFLVKTKAFQGAIFLRRCETTVLTDFPD